MLESTNIIVESADVDVESTNIIDIGFIFNIGKFVLFLLAVYIHHYPDSLEGRIKIHPTLKKAIILFVSFVWFCVTMVIVSIVATVCLTIFMVVLTITVNYVFQNGTAGN